MGILSSYAVAKRALVVATVLIAAASPSTGALADLSTKAAPMSPNPSSTENQLLAVSSVSSTNAWAVGYYVDDGTGFSRTLIVHWNGTTWSQVSSPSPSSTVNSLLGVRAINGSNVWAVGYYRNDTSAIPETLVEHWNGTTWSVIHSPSPSATDNELLGVNGGGSQGGVWAVGTDVNDAGDFYETLTLRWNGSKWVREPSPNPSHVDNQLRAVREPSSTNAWAVGTYAPIPDSYRTLILHWNGTTWSRVTSPNPSPGDDELNSTSGVSPTNAWAVGHYANGSQYVTFTVHWNGTTWSKVNSPSPSSTNNDLRGVRAIAANDIWAVGYYIDDLLHTTQTLTLHWNGTKWSRVSSPNPGDTGDALYAVVATSSSDVWAVGSYHDSVSASTKTLILHWNGHTWVQK